MDAATFRRKMEEFGRSRNIPLRDILYDIDEIGLESMTVDADEREAFFARSYAMYCLGFPQALPPGTKSLREREGSDSD